MVQPSAATVQYKAAQLEAALRRHLSRKELRAITTKPQLRPLIHPITGTRKYPGRPCYKDLEANKSVLRAVVEVYPDRIPSAFIVASAIRKLDEFYSGDVIQYEGHGGFVADGYLEASVSIAALVKTLVQRLRRLFRPSSRSRFL